MQTCKAKGSSLSYQQHVAPIQSVCLTICSRYKEMYGKYRMVKSLLVNSTVSAQNKRKLASKFVLCRLCRFDWRI